MKSLKKRTRTKRNTHKRRNNKSKQYGGGARQVALHALTNFHIAHIPVLLQIRSYLESAEEYTLADKITQAKQLLDELEDELERPAAPRRRHTVHTEAAPAA